MGIVEIPAGWGGSTGRLVGVSLRFKARGATVDPQARQALLPLGESWGERSWWWPIYLQRPLSWHPVYVDLAIRVPETLSPEELDASIHRLLGEAQLPADWLSCDPVEELPLGLPNRLRLRLRQRGAKDAALAALAAHRFEVISGEFARCCGVMLKAKQAFPVNVVYPDGEGKGIAQQVYELKSENIVTIVFMTRFLMCKSIPDSPELAQLLQPAQELARRDNAEHPWPGRVVIIPHAEKVHFASLGLDWPALALYAEQLAAEVRWVAQQAAVTAAVCMNGRSDIGFSSVDVVAALLSGTPGLEEPFARDSKVWVREDGLIPENLAEEFLRHGDRRVAGRFMDTLRVDEWTPHPARLPPSLLSAFRAVAHRLVAES